jgi:hypothetical protein
MRKIKKHRKIVIDTTVANTPFEDVLNQIKQTTTVKEVDSSMLKINEHNKVVIDPIPDNALIYIEEALEILSEYIRDNDKALINILLDMLESLYNNNSSRLVFLEKLSPNNKEALEMIKKRLNLQDTDFDITNEEGELVPLNIH